MPKGENITTSYKIDISDLKKGISEANKQIKLANAEFKAASAGMDDWRKSTDGVEAKLKQLNSVLSSQKSVLDAYRKQLDEQEKAYSENGKRVEELKAKLKDLADNGVDKASKQYKDYESALRDCEKEQERNKTAADNLKYQIQLQETAVEKTENEIGKYNKALDDLEKEAKDAEDDVNKLGNEVEDSGIQAEGSEKKFEKLGKVISGMAKASAAALAAVGAATVKLGKELYDAAKETSEAGDRIDKMSQKMGMSTEAFQEWDYVLGQSGVEIDSLQVGMKTLTNQTAAATKGNQAAIDKFKKLGISLKDLKTLSREDLFKRVIQGFQGMEDNADRAALANQLLGRSGQSLTPLFNETAESTQALIDKAHDLGFVMSEEAVKASADFNDSLDTLQRTFTGVKNNIIGELLPGFTQMMDGFAQVIAGSEEGKEKIKQGAEELVESLKNAAPRVTDVLMTLVSAAAEIAPTIIESLISGISGNLPQLMTSAGKIAETLLFGIIEAAPQVAQGAIQVLNTLADTILDPENIRLVIDTGFSVAETLIDALAKMAPELIPKAVEGILDALLRATENAPNLLDSGVELVVGIAEGLAKALPVFVEKLPKILENVIDSIVGALTDEESLDKMFKAGIKLFYSLVKSVFEIDKILRLQIKKMVAKVFEPLDKLTGGAVSKLLGLDYTDSELAEAQASIDRATSSANGHAGGGGNFAGGSSGVSRSFGGTATNAADAVANAKNSISGLSADLNKSLSAQMASNVTDASKTVNNNFTQNIYAPQQPSRIELYRQTRNLLDYAKVGGA